MTRISYRKPITLIQPTGLRFGGQDPETLIQVGLFQRQAVFEQLKTAVVEAMQELSFGLDQDTRYTSGKVAASGILQAYATMAGYMLPPEDTFTKRPPT